MNDKWHIRGKSYGMTNMLKKHVASVIKYHSLFGKSPLAKDLEFSLLRQADACDIYCVCSVLGKEIITTLCFSLSIFEIDFHRRKDTLIIGYIMGNFVGIKLCGWFTTRLV